MTRYRIVVFAVLLWASPSVALEPSEVFLLVNRNEPAGSKLAKTYCELRKVPAGNVIVLDVSTGDDITREDYDAKIVGPVRAALKGSEGKAKCLLSIYGMPLRVGAPLPTPEQAKLMKPFQDAISALNARIEPLQKSYDAVRESTVPAEVKRRADMQKEIAELNKQLAAPRDEMAKIFTPLQEAYACVDSELMLLWWDGYPLQRFVYNPLHWQFPPEKRKGSKPVLMTSRLDGPTAEIAEKLVTNAIAAEAKGLTGKVYVDARGLKEAKTGDPGWGLEGYDESMREMAALLRDTGKMDVVLDDKPDLFPVGSCKDCALYCGWYSVGNFVDCCEFTPGAIAWHLASYEAITLKGETRGWCKNLLLKGATATLGPVGEPYTAGFPKPAEFFGFLATGKFTLVEAYARTALLTSWMTVLVGDPLYNPYKNSPKIKVEDVKSSPKWGRHVGG